MTMLGLAAATALTSLIQNGDPDVDVKVSSITSFRAVPKQCDRAQLLLDFDLDLRKLWTWNVAHIYASILAKYSTSKFSTNEIVLWDSIISKPSAAKISKRAQKNKYAFKDYGFGLRDANVTLYFRYSVFPTVGHLCTKTAAPVYEFVMPSDYI